MVNLNVNVNKSIISLFTYRWIIVIWDVKTHFVTILTNQAQMKQDKEKTNPSYRAFGCK